MVMEKIMTNNAAKKALSSSPSNPMPEVIAPEPESIPQEADTEVFEAKAGARREKVKKQRREKLSASMKAKLASGDMCEMVERRKANNAVKKASSSSPPKPRVITPWTPRLIQQEAEASEVAGPEANAKKAESKKTNEKLAASMKALRAAGEMHEVVERKKAKNVALATSSTAPVEPKRQNDHQDAMEMEQQPLTGATAVQKLVSRPDTTFEDTPLDMKEVDEVERTTDNAEQGSDSSATTAAKVSITRLPSTDKMDKASTS